jgi:hypothetical protein
MRSGRTSPDSDAGDRVDPRTDDWLWEEIDWSKGREQVGPESVPSPEAAGRARGSSTVDSIPAADSTGGRQTAVEVGRHALIRRRRLAALAALGLLFAAALVVPLVVFEGGQNAAEQTTPLTTVPPRSTARERPATTTAPQSTAPTAPKAKPLRLALPEGGAIRRGDRGSAVVTLQKALAALGFATGEPDGVFGQVTEAAVIDFQRSNNLPPDGVVGADTARLLNSALVKRGVTQ